MVFELYIMQIIDKKKLRTIALFLKTVSGIARI